MRVGLMVPSVPDDRRRILETLLVIAIVIQIGKGQRGLWVWAQLDGCDWGGITR